MTIRPVVLALLGLRPMVEARVSSSDTLAIAFTNLTVALCTPAAGTYAVLAIRS